MLWCWRWSWLQPRTEPGSGLSPLLKGFVSGFAASGAALLGGRVVDEHCSCLAHVLFGVRKNVLCALSFSGDVFSHRRFLPVLTLVR